MCRAKYERLTFGVMSLPRHDTFAPPERQLIHTRWILSFTATKIINFHCGLSRWYVACLYTKILLTTEHSLLPPPLSVVKHAECSVENWRTDVKYLSSGVSEHSIKCLLNEVNYWLVTSANITLKVSSNSRFQSFHCKYDNLMSYFHIPRISSKRIFVVT